MLTRTYRYLAQGAIVAVLLLSAGLPCRAASFFRFADDSKRVQEEGKAARKFDEFLELLGECNLGARLDNLAIQLQSEPESKSFIIVYSGKYETPQVVSSYRNNIGNYLVNSRGVDPARLTILDGGYRQILTTEIWIAAKGAQPPEPTDTINFKQELDQAFKFGEYHVYLADSSQDFTEQFSEEAETIEDAEAASAANEVVAEQPVEAQEETVAAQPEEAVEVPVEVQEEEEAVEANVWWASKGYARALDMEAKARGLLIFYADRAYADFSRMKDVVELGKTRLIEKHGVKAERLTMIFGGYRESSAVELWLVPANASLPLPTPDPEKQEEAVKLAK